LGAFLMAVIVVVVLGGPGLILASAVCHGHQLLHMIGLVENEGIGIVLHLVEL